MKRTGVLKISASVLNNCVFKKNSLALLIFYLVPFRSLRWSRNSLILNFITSLLRTLSQRLSSSGNGRNDPPTCSRNRRFIRILCRLLGGGISIFFVSSSNLRIFESNASNNARRKSSRFSLAVLSKKFSSFILLTACFVVLL